MRIMFIRSMAFMFFFLIFLQGAIGAEETGVIKNSENVSNKLLVKFYPEATDEKRTAIREELGAEMIKGLKEISAEVWELPDGLPIEDAINKLKEETSVECSEPDYKYKPQAISNEDRFKKE